MKISTKGRYALRMMIDLAQRDAAAFVPLGEIAQRQGVSKKYLEQIIPALTKEGLLRTVRGAQGGYALGRDPERITVGQILRLTEGSLSPVECTGDPSLCERSEYCLMLPVYKGLDRVVNEYLDSVTLKSVIEGDGGGSYVI